MKDGKAEVALAEAMERQQGRNSRLKVRVDCRYSRDVYELQQ